MEIAQRLDAFGISPSGMLSLFDTTVAEQAYYQEKL